MDDPAGVSQQNDETEGPVYPAVNAALAQRVDPTQTTVLRERRFKPALTKRYRAVRGAIRTTIQSNDALQLPAQRRRQSGGGISAALAPEDAEPRQQFRGADDAAVQVAFLQWVENTLNEAVLETTSEQQVRQGNHYSSEYIREAYHNGLRDAAQQLREAGEDVPEPESTPEGGDGTETVLAAASAVTLAALFQRTYSAIRGTVQTAVRDVSRVFDELYPQASKTALTQEVNRAIADGGESDAVHVARSEPIYAYAEGQLDQFEEYGVEEVSVEEEVKLSTAGDSRVCKECRRKAREGPYTISEIRRNPLTLHPPLHTQCRCRLVFVA